MENILVNGMLHSIEDVSRYGYFDGIDDDKQKLCDALADTYRFVEQFNELLECSSQSITNIENCIEEIRDDLEADIIGSMGIRYYPLKLFDVDNDTQLELKERYEEVITKLTRLETELGEFEFLNDELLNKGEIQKWFES